MGKVKINLTSGNVIEKPVVTCFKANNAEYLVLDNETNGSMGLPIICISKFNGTVAEKIFDQNEWGLVKENLKNIIAGNTVEYVNVPDSITAQDDFYTQLTLPLASFDLLKNVYKPAVVEEPVAPAPVQETSAPVVEEPAAPVMPEATAIAAPIIDANPVAAPVIEAPTPIAEPVAPVITSPVENTPLEMPAATIEPPVMPMPESPVVEAPAAPVMPAMPEQTALAAPVTSTVEDIPAIKAAFMQSCENMFDALIKKFENK